ncbi:FixH family protein [Sporosarcina sp. YIM B06819]|uniref:FixH family protein n=1 Tax=Sporosarcina sp. YIM B06819 TaxID=3081769 RepID=UPI00298C27BE|nr:FixH family protein [Sporosarcina sp. YIM B06819]
MKQKKLMFVAGLVLATMAACSNEKPKDVVVDEVPQPIIVDLTVTEKVEVGGTVNMAAVVTQGDEKVADADEVLFEFWEEGKKNDSVKVESVNEKDGLYTAETTFDHDGVFHVQVHVTARGLHTMPMKEVIVGNGAAVVEEHGTEEHGEGHHDHGGHAEGFSMHFLKPEQVKAAEDLDLVVHLEMDGHPLENARVRYEIWHEATPDQHDWLDATETKTGEYASTYTFAQAGTYSIQIHVQDNKELHEHEIYTIVVE